MNLNLNLNIELEIYVINIPRQEQTKFFMSLFCVSFRVVMCTRLCVFVNLLIRSSQSCQINIIGRTLII